MFVYFDWNVANFLHPLWASTCLASLAFTSTIPFLSFRISQVVPASILTASFAGGNGEISLTMLSSAVDKMKQLSLCGDVLRTLFFFGIQYNHHQMSQFQSFPETDY